MGPVAEGIVIGIGGTLGATIVGMVGATMRKLWKTPKRVDRLERLLPTMARALLILLRIHAGEDVNGDIKTVLNELDGVLTNGSVSLKEKS